MQASDNYAFHNGFFFFDAGGINNYAAARMKNSSLITDYIELPRLKRVNGLTVETDGSFATNGMNKTEKWAVSKNDESGNPIYALGIDDSLSVAVYDGISIASDVIS